MVQGVLPRRPAAKGERGSESEVLIAFPPPSREDGPVPAVSAGAWLAHAYPMAAPDERRTRSSSWNPGDEPDAAVAKPNQELGGPQRGDLILDGDRVGTPVGDRAVECRWRLGGDSGSRPTSPGA
jgi:hypothetical protein